MKALKIVGLVIVGFIILIVLLIALNPEARDAVNSGYQEGRESGQTLGQ